MKLVAHPKRVVQVYEALVAEIARGNLRPGERLIQEQIAAELGVSRQPVQQALLLLRNQGALRDAEGRGLIVAPIDPGHVRNMYDIRAVIEGLAFRRAAESGADEAARLGPALIEQGRRAVASGSVADLIAADLAFHGLILGLSGNPLIAPMMEAQWIYAQRVMGAAQLQADAPRVIWAEHEAMLKAVIRGDADDAEALARQHVARAATVVIEVLGQRQPISKTPDSARE